MVNKNEKYGLWFSLLEMKNVIAKVYLSGLVFKEIHLTFLDKCLLIIKQGNLFLGHIVANIEAVLYHARWPCDPLSTRERYTMMTAEGPCKAFVFLERERERQQQKEMAPREALGNVTSRDVTSGTAQSTCYQQENAVVLVIPVCLCSTMPEASFGTFESWG